MKSANTCGRAGFTLIEVMVSVILFGIACGATLQLTHWAVQANAFGQRTTEAMNTGQDKMEELLLLGKSGIAPGTDRTGIFLRTWTTGYQGMANAVSVEVSWRDQNGKNHVVHVNNIAN